MKLTFKNIALGIFLFCLFSLWAAGQIVGRRYEARLPQGNPATLEKANRVTPGMTPEQVQAIFVVPGYSPTPSPQSSITSISWMNHNLSSVGVIFENGRVINVVRSGDLPQEQSTE
ncbi:hypothetical protein IAD21_03740 [Abditibacteriota bacterium]|nr:hypothetical protein IAD21_03740 [Abditibacteriota bacterium]